MRTVEEWKQIFPRYPESGKDDGYMKAVEWDSDELPVLLDKYGFALVKILNPAECDVALDAFFDDIQKQNENGLRVDINDQSTWERKFWPTKKGKVHETIFEELNYSCFMVSANMNTKS